MVDCEVCLGIFHKLQNVMCLKGPKLRSIIYFPLARVVGQGNGYWSTLKTGFTIT